MESRLRITRVRAVLIVVGVALVSAAVAYATIPDGAGVIHGCYTKKGGLLTVIDPSAGQSCSSLQTPLNWNQQGPKGDPGLKGDPGPQGAEGPAGGDAFSVEKADDLTIPNGGGATVLTLANVPAGKYVIVANIVVSNHNSPETIPVSCYIGNPNVEFSPPYSARLDPFSSAGASAHTASGASTQTIALALTTQFSDAADINLLCTSNTGTGNTAEGSTRQITAIKVANLNEDDLAP